MRISVIIFSVLLSQISASFFSEFTSSMYSVQSSVGKFISDAAGDLKDTFDCTVFAVRQAISSNISLAGYEKCQNDPNVIPLSSSNPVQIVITVLSTPSPTNVEPEKKVKTTVMPTPKLIDNNNTKTNDDFVKKQSIENDLLGETRILVNISSKLEHEFEDLSKHVNDDLAKIENEQKQLSMEKIMNEIDKLLAEEIKYKNNTDSKIREVFEKLTTKLDNDTTNKFDIKKEIKIALAELEYNKNQSNVEQELKLWKEEELKNLSDIRNMLKKQKQHQKQNKTNTKMPNTTKPEVAKPIKPVKTARTAKRAKSLTLKDTVSKGLPTKATKRTPIVRTTTKAPPTPTKASTAKPADDYDSLVSADKQTLDLALQLFGNSKKTAAVMASVLKNEKSAPNVFDRPELLTR